MLSPTLEVRQHVFLLQITKGNGCLIESLGEAGYSYSYPFGSCKYLCVSFHRCFQRQGNSRSIAISIHLSDGSPDYDKAFERQTNTLHDCANRHFLRTDLQEEGVTPDSEVLEDGTKAHWIGDKKAEKLIINFHGGGYVVPASPEMVEFMFKVVDTLTDNGKSVAVLFLSYDLAPGAVYPRQLQQAAALLNHVLHTLKVSPKDIVLTGDSAGANLMIGLLSHISHPWNESYPTSSSLVSLKGGIPPVNLGDEKLCGAVMISPWISFSLAEPSFKKNAYKDVIDPRSGKQWSSAWMNTPHPHTNNTDYYNQAITAPTSWWKDIKVDNVLIVAGKDEVLIDGVMKFTEKFGEGFGKEKLQVFVAEDEYHDQPSLDIGLRYVKPGQQALKIQEWVSSKL